MSEPARLMGRLLGGRPGAVRPAGWTSLDPVDPGTLAPPPAPTLPEGDLRAMREATRGLRAAITQIPALVEERLDGLAALVLDMGLTIAEQVLDTRIERGDMKLVPILRRILAEAVEGGKAAKATVFVNAEDLGAFATGLRDDNAASAELLRFEVDDSLRRGCLRVETSAGTWHYDPREVVARLREELKGTPL